MSPRTGSRNSGKNVISTPFEKAPRTAPRCPPAPFPITPAASFTEQVRETFAGRVTGFYRQQSILGHDITTQVLRNGIAVNAEAAQALQLDPTDELIVLERLRYVNGALHQHVETYLPASKYPGVLAHDFSSGSLFDYLEQAYEVVMSRNDLLARVEVPSPAMAHLLQAKPGTAILAVDSTVYSDGDTPVAFGIARHTPANSEISFSMRNPS